MQGFPVLMHDVLEIVVARTPHEWLHLYLWNCLSLVPFLFSLYVHCYPDSHVFHGFHVFGCLLNDQLQRTLRQTEKDLDVGGVLQYFHFRHRFRYPLQYLQMQCVGPKHGAASCPRLGKEQCPPLHREKYRVSE